LPGGSTLLARIDGKYESSHLTENLHTDFLQMGLGQYVEVDSRTIGNLNGVWSSAEGRFSVSAYVRNFTNEKYATYDVQGNPNSFLVDWTDPRTYGVALSARF
jgi:outer membrane receptor protein involved in Fe transport